VRVFGINVVGSSSIILVLKIIFVLIITIFDRNDSVPATWNKYVTDYTPQNQQLQQLNLKLNLTDVFQSHTDAFNTARANWRSMLMNSERTKESAHTVRQYQHVTFNRRDICSVYNIRFYSRFRSQKYHWLLLFVSRLIISRSCGYCFRAQSLRCCWCRSIRLRLLVLTSACESRYLPRAPSTNLSACGISKPGRLSVLFSVLNDCKCIHELLIVWTYVPCDAVNYMLWFTKSGRLTVTVA